MDEEDEVDEEEEENEGSEQDQEEREKEQEILLLTSRTRIEEPRTEIFEKLTKKEQEAIMRYFNEVSQIESRKEREGFLRTKPKEQQEAVKKFLKELEVKRRQDQQHQRNLKVKNFNCKQPYKNYLNI